jgi:membrane-associated protease RseP (regulator of RpoE activity)
LPGDVFVSVDNVTIDNYDTLDAIVANKNPGDIIQVTVIRGENWEEHFSTSITLTEIENKSVMGITSFDPLGPLTFYRTMRPDTLSLYMVPPSLYPGLVPFSDSLIPFYTHGLGAQWHVYANLFFWLWFVNVNVAVFNALPIYPLDGGRMFNITLKSVLGRKVSEKTITRITAAVTVTIIWILLMNVLIPFIL